MLRKGSTKKQITLSVIKADIGGWVGHTTVHPDTMAVAEKILKKARAQGLLVDFRVLACGDDLQLIMTHRKGPDAEKIHELAWNTFLKATEIAKKLKLYGAGQDLLTETFSGNVKGAGPGVAEAEFVERPSEPVIVFMADKTEAGSWNWPLYKIYADPFSTPGLVIDPAMHEGFIFEVHDVKEHKKVELRTPEESYDLIGLIGQPGRFVVKSVHRKDGLLAAVSSTQKLSLVAGKYVGKDDPVCFCRCQHGLPAVGETLEPYAFPFLVAGWMRGSHRGPFVPCSFRGAHPARFDGPPRVMAAGFQLANGKLIGPRDLFDDVSFDRARAMANEIADYMRRHGLWEPHRLGEEEMEYTTLPKVLAKLKMRFKEL